MTSVVSGDDFPYYNDQPFAISGVQWLALLLAVAAGFAALVAPLPLPAGAFGGFARAVLFVGIPLLVLRLVAGQYWTALFRKVSGRDVLWMLFFALLNFFITVGIGAYVLDTFGAAANPSIESLIDQSVGERILFFANTVPQLIGEEVLTIIPFLAIMYFVYKKLGWSRKSAIIWAWILSSIMFGMMHLPSYDWNWVQCIVVIGSARLILSLAYFKTKNLWVSAGAHIINDWTIFGITVLGASITATAS